ncbi:hypothetical protein [Paenibacillus apiarius]|uniref:hypothetical protein n=1 Tax=Paenibacillus apiarius TaxID=46240 RepID=UPI003B3AE570
MSFVSVVATEHFVTVMSDGRVKNMETGEILEEDYVKFHKSSDGKQFVAYAGNKQLCEILSKKILQYLEDGCEYDNLILILNTTIYDTFKDQFGVMFAFGGINKDKQIEVYAYGNKKQGVLKFKPENGNLAYTFLFHGKISDGELDEKFDGLIKEIGRDTPSKIIQSQKLLNSYVSEQDDTVNNNTFRMIIKR